MKITMNNSNSDHNDDHYDGIIIFILMTMINLKRCEYRRQLSHCEWQGNNISFHVVMGVGVLDLTGKYIPWGQAYQQEGKTIQPSGGQEEFENSWTNEKRRGYEKRWRDHHKTSTGFKEEGQLADKVQLRARKAATCPDPHLVHRSTT